MFGFVSRIKAPTSSSSATGNQQAQPIPSPASQAPAVTLKPQVSVNPSTLIAPT